MVSQLLSGFERHEPIERGSVSAPRVTVYSGKLGRFNAAARRTYGELRSARRAFLFYDSDRGLVGIMPTSQGGVAVSAVGGFSMQGILKSFGIRCDGTRHFDLFRDGMGMYVFEVGKPDGVTADEAEA